MQKKAVIILGHGSKSQDAKEDFNYIVNLTKKNLNQEHVYGAHMELAKPSLEDVVANISELDITEIIIIPYFLYKGIHIKEDIPQIIKKLESQYKHISFQLGSPIGKDPLMAEMLSSKIKGFGF